MTLRHNDEIRALTPREEEARDRWESELGDMFLLEITDPGSDTNGKGLGITLHVNGKTICGDVCSGAEWAGYLAAWEKQSTGRSESIFDSWFSTFRDGFAEYNAAWDRADDPNPTEQDIEQRWITFRFIHLLNAYEMAGTGATIPKGGVPMRVRRSSVDAWSLGKLGSPST